VSWSLPRARGRSATVEQVLTEASQAYQGRMEVGEDLMRIVIGETTDVQHVVDTPKR